MMFYGRGAGDMPTASALVSDLIKAGRAKRHALPAVFGEAEKIADDWNSVYFIRMLAMDELGVLSMVSGKLAGHGVSAKIDGRAVLVGNERLMQANGVDVANCTHEGTMVHVAADGQYLGHIVIDDAVKPDSADAILALRRLGVTKTVMLTGDQKSVAERVGRELGLDEVRAELLPGDKVGCVEELLVKKANGTLLFVGDGMNDAPVLSRADVGVAMGALGSDAAIEAADVVLMDDQPSKLALAIRIGRRTRSIARQNIVFALAVKLVFMVLTVLGVTNMGPAVFADVGVMVLAVLNSTRAMRIRQ